MRQAIITMHVDNNGELSNNLFTKAFKIENKNTTRRKINIRIAIYL